MLCLHLLTKGRISSSPRTNVKRLLSKQGVSFYSRVPWSTLGLRRQSQCICHTTDKGRVPRQLKSHIGETSTCCASDISWNILAVYYLSMRNRQVKPWNIIHIYFQWSFNDNRSKRYTWVPESWKDSSLGHNGYMKFNSNHAYTSLSRGRSLHVLEPTIHEDIYTVYLHR